MSGVTPGWGPVTRGVLQGPILSPVLFNNFITNLDTVLKEILSKFIEDSKLAGAVDTLEVREALKRELG